MLTEEGSGKDAMEELQKQNLHLPSTDQVYILPTPAAQFVPEAPTAKAKASPSPLLVQNFKKLVATVQTFATTSKTLAAHTTWHNRWFGCWFRFGALEPQQFH